MSYEITKDEILKVFTDLGFKRNSINKKITDDFHSNYFSINSVENIIALGNHIGNYIFDIDIAFNISNNEDYDDRKVLFDTLVLKLSKLDRFMGFNKNPILKQKDKDPKKLIGNLNFLFDNFYC